LRRLLVKIPGFRWLEYIPKKIHDFAPKKSNF